MCDFLQSGMVLQGDPLPAHVYGTTDSIETVRVEVICNSGFGGEYQGTNVCEITSCLCEMLMF